MKIPIYQIDAFSEKTFGGNPAAVCPLENWIDDALMQEIAAENNLSETAFFVRGKDQYIIRWFTPVKEMDLCGHATLASAYVIFNYVEPELEHIQFHAPRSGSLAVRKETNGQYTLDFPAASLQATPTPKHLIESLHKIPVACWETTNKLLVLLSNQKELAQLQPNFYELAKVDKEGIIVTAPGEAVDFVSRCFFPRLGIDEDPVTGSAHTLLIPFWAERLGKHQLQAVQLSKGKGQLQCQLHQDRVLISGYAALYMKGELSLNNSIDSYNNLFTPELIIFLFFLVE